MSLYLFFLEGGVGGAAATRNSTVGGWVGRDHEKQQDNAAEVSVNHGCHFDESKTRLYLHVSIPWQNLQMIRV